MSREVIRPDFILSYWLFTWYILYVCGVIKYNPKLFLILGLIENIIQLILKIIHKNTTISIISFIIINTIIKVIPILTLWNKQIHLKEDIFIGMSVTAIFLLWLLYNKKLDIKYLISIIQNGGDIESIPPFEFMFTKLIEKCVEKQPN